MKITETIWGCLSCGYSTLKTSDMVALHSSENTTYHFLCRNCTEKAAELWIEHDVHNVRKELESVLTSCGCTGSISSSSRDELHNFDKKINKGEIENA